MKYLHIYHYFLRLYNIYNSRHSPYFYVQYVFSIAYTSTLGAKNKSIHLCVHRVNFPLNLLCNCIIYNFVYLLKLLNNCFSCLEIENVQYIFPLHLSSKLCSRLSARPRVRQYATDNNKHSVLSIRLQQQIRRFLLFHFERF